MGISLEIGVFYDHSALGVRKNNVVVVPAISVHDERLIDAIRGRPRVRVRSIPPARPVKRP